MTTTPATAAVACEHRECTGGKYDGWKTWANLVTTVRTAACVILVGIGLWQRSDALLLSGLAVYWVGDIADGLVARLLRQETRTGAVYDILSDRLCVAFFYLAYASLHPEMILPIAIFLANFMLVDNQLSLAFLKWPVLSPNYFYAVDRKVYDLNWSKLAKATNTSLFLIIVLITQLWWLAALVALAQLGIKLYSTVLVTRIPPPSEPEQAEKNPDQIP